MSLFLVYNLYIVGIYNYFNIYTLYIGVFILNIPFFFRWRVELNIINEKEQNETKFKLGIKRVERNKKYH